MATIELTPAVLRVLAEGLDRLNDGDDRDRSMVDDVEETLMDLGYLRSNLSIWEATADEIQTVRDQAAADKARFEAQEAKWSALMDRLVAERTDLSRDELIDLAEKMMREDPNA